MSAPQTSNGELLKISELAERSGVPVATIRHYLREGLLPEPVKTSRNMAYYPPEFVDRIRLIKQLQEERFMPLRVIRELLERGDVEPERLRAMLDLEDRILERALAGERERVPSQEVRDRRALQDAVLQLDQRMCAPGVLVDHALDQPQGHEAVLLQALDQTDALDELGRVVGHVARGADRLGQQPLAQVVLDRAGRDAGALRQLTHLEQVAVHPMNDPRTSCAGPWTAPAASIASTCCSS